MMTSRCLASISRSPKTAFTMPISAGKKSPVPLIIFRTLSAVLGSYPSPNDRAIASSPGRGTTTDAWYGVGLPMGQSSQLFRRIDVTANVATEHHAGVDFDARTEQPRSVSSPKSYGRHRKRLPKADMLCRGKDEGARQLAACPSAHPRLVSVAAMMTVAVLFFLDGLLDNCRLGR